MRLGFIYRCRQHMCMHGLRLLLVLSLAPLGARKEKGTPVFPTLQRATFSNSNSTMNGRRSRTPMWMCYLTFCCLRGTFMYQRHYVFTDFTLVPVTMTLCSKNGYSATPWLNTDMFKTETVFFTSISDFYQARFCLIPIAEGSSAGTSILFIVLRDKECLVTSYQRRLYEESLGMVIKVIRFSLCIVL